MNHIARRWRYVPAFPQVKALAFKITLYERLVFVWGQIVVIIVLVIILVIIVQFGSEEFLIKEIEETEKLCSESFRIRKDQCFISVSDAERSIFMLEVRLGEIGLELVDILNDTLFLVHGDCLPWNRSLFSEDYCNSPPEVEK